MITPSRNDTQLEYKRIIQQEYLKCFENPAYFCKKYCYIFKPVVGKIPFHLYKFQENTLADLVKYDYNIILKSRQLGISTLSAGYALWDMIFHEGRSILVIATKQDVAKNLVEKVIVMFENLPSWLKMGVLEKNKLSLKLSNGSNVRAISAAGDSGRSFACSTLIIDEAAFIPGIDEIWTAAQPVLSNGGKCIVLSTPNGIGGFFHREYVKAENNEGIFHPIKLDWSVHPDRDDVWRESQTVILGTKMAAQECFNGETRIYTKNGLKRIDSININDFVLSHDGTYNKVSRIYTHESSDLYEIKSSNNYMSRFVTANHPFYNLNNEWISAKDTTQNQFLRSFPLNTEITKIEPVVDLYELVTPKFFKKVLCEDTNYFYINDRKHKRVHNRYITVGYELGYFIGLFLAKGCKCKNRVVFSFNYEIESNDWPIHLSDFMKDNFNISNYTIRRKSVKSADVEICSEILSNTVSLFVDGDRCYNKKLSEFSYLNGNYSFYKGILDGTFAVDGCLTNTANKSLSITSEDMIYDIKYISSIIGYNISSIKFISNKKFVPRSGFNSCRNTYMLSFLKTRRSGVIDRKMSSVLADEMYDMYAPDKRSCFLDDEYLNSKIKLTKVNKTLQVYNLEVENTHTYVTEHFVVHNCDADFTSSGDTLVEMDILNFYKDTFIKDPTQIRDYYGGAMWIWGIPESGHRYVVSADCSRGDGKDFHALHVLDLDTLEQVAEYKGVCGTTDFGNMLVAISTEYNDALLLIENASYGWAVIQQVINRSYKNLFYSSSDLKYVDTQNSYNNKIYAAEKKLVPGVTTSIGSRPLMINKLGEYFRERSLIIRSNRLLQELYVFVWLNGKAQARSGYNDDLVMSLCFALWVRDTSLKLMESRSEMNKSMIESFKVERPTQDALYSTKYDNVQTQWNMNINGENEKLDWLL